LELKWTSCLALLGYQGTFGDAKRTIALG